MDKIDNELERLNELVDSGIEYPIAEFQVREEFNLRDSHITELRERYDTQL